MVSSAIQKANLIAPTVGKTLEMYSGQLVSLNATAFRDSLPTLKTATDTPTPPAPQELSYIPSWASCEGFRELCRELDFGDYKSPLHFRQRFILEEIRQKGYFNGS